MSEQVFFGYLLNAWLLLAVAVFVFLFIVPAPYGRHLRRDWGPTLHAKPAWVVMEAPAVLVFGACFVFAGNAFSITLLVFMVMWQAHYIHRAFLYPLSLSPSARNMPLLIVASGLVFNLVNAYLNGRYLFAFSDGYNSGWLADPRFATGTFLFVAGFIINRQADGILQNLRKDGGFGYQVPDGGLYRWVSCPNYLGEMLIWIGWAVATWSLPGLAFAVWTVANLAPRARAHHNWYRENMTGYPEERKALIPRLW